MEKIKNKYILISNNSHKYILDINYLISKIWINKNDVFFIVLKWNNINILKKNNFKYIQVNNIYDILKLDKSNYILWYGRWLWWAPFDQLWYFLWKFKNKIRIHDWIDLWNNIFKWKIIDISTWFLNLLIIYLKFYWLLMFTYILILKLKWISVDKYIGIKNYWVLELNRILDEYK